MYPLLITLVTGPEGAVPHANQPVRVPLVVAE